jgi:hypothetical protein
MSAELGFFDRRYTPTPIWKENEFKGGNKPSLVVTDAEGGSREPIEEDSRGRPLNRGSRDQRPGIGGSGNSPPPPASETGESEASSVVSVRDLGFGASPFPAYEQVHDSDPIGHVMTARELRCHLGLHEKPGASVEQAIYDDIEKWLVDSQMDEKEYLPMDHFERIFDLDCLKALARERHPDMDDTDLRNEINHLVVRRRILGILSFSKRLRYLNHFITGEICDHHLPMKQVVENKNKKRRAVTLQGSKEGHQNLELFEDWERRDVDLFFLYQPMFFVPFFDIQEDRLCEYVLDRDIRLPWDAHEQKTSGGNGLVYQIQIHPSHHNFVKGDEHRPLYFALKEIDAPDRNTYRHELLALKKTLAQTQREKHLIRLLLTFQHGEKNYLLFEWADGNLEEFWETRRMPPSPSLAHAKWAALQCHGIACAVKRIHGLSTWQKQQREQNSCSLSPSGASIGPDHEKEWGRHGDIKPKNILWFSSYDVRHGNEEVAGEPAVGVKEKRVRDLLVVSDLGLTRYHSRLTRSLIPHTQLDGCTWNYRPPEMDLAGQNISQKYDIWSLGCVFLEFCIWYLGGMEALWDFEAQRVKEDESPFGHRVEEDKFFNLRKDEKGHVTTGELKPVVRKVRASSQLSRSWFLCRISFCLETKCCGSPLLFAVTPATRHQIGSFILSPC